MVDIKRYCLYGDPAYIMSMCLQVGNSRLRAKKHKNCGMKRWKNWDRPWSDHTKICKSEADVGTKRLQALNESSPGIHSYTVKNLRSAVENQEAHVIYWSDIMYFWCDFRRCSSSMCPLSKKVKKGSQMCREPQNAHMSGLPLIGRNGWQGSGSTVKLQQSSWGLLQSFIKELEWAIKDLKYSLSTPSRYNFLKNRFSSRSGRFCCETLLFRA